MWRGLIAGMLLIGTLAGAVPGAHAAGKPDVAALQVGLRARGLYAGAIDGLAGPATARAIRVLGVRDGGATAGTGEAVRRALGPYGRWRLGSRVLAAPAAGWDVAALQFSLAWRGFPSGPIDGRYTERTARAVRRFQRWTGVTADGVVGSATLSRLTTARPQSSVALALPVRAPFSGLFGPRDDRFHTGLDFGAPFAAPIAAAAPGTVTYAGWHSGGWGNLVVVRHRSGLRTLYAHMSSVRVRLGASVRAGDVVGAVGATGRSSGPHLHFEARVRGAAVDPRPLLTR